MVDPLEEGGRELYWWRVFPLLFGNVEWGKRQCLSLSLSLPLCVKAQWEVVGSHVVRAFSLSLFLSRGRFPVSFGVSFARAWRWAAASKIHRNHRTARAVCSRRSRQPPQPRRVEHQPVLHPSACERQTYTYLPICCTLTDLSYNSRQKARVTG